MQPRDDFTVNSGQIFSQQPGIHPISLEELRQAVSEYSNEFPSSVPPAEEFIDDPTQPYYATGLGWVPPRL